MIKIRNSLLLLLFLVLGAYANASGTRTLRLSEKQIGKIRVTPGRTTILSFPTKPTKVLLGNKGLFSIEYIENDIALAAMAPTARSNLFVYLEGRRFAFNVVTSPTGDEIVFVRDPKESEVKVKIR